MATLKAGDMKHASHLDYPLNCPVCRRRYPVSVCQRNPPLGAILQHRIELLRLQDSPLEVHALAVELLIEHDLATRRRLV